MLGYNSISLIGNIGKMVLRYTQTGHPVLSINLAENYLTIDKESGEKNKEVQWHNLVAFEKMAENIHAYQEVGSKIFVEGKLRSRTYIKDHIEYRTFNVIVNRIQFLDAKSKESHELVDPDTSAEAMDESHFIEHFDPDQKTQIQP